VIRDIDRTSVETDYKIDNFSLDVSKAVSFVRNLNSLFFMDHLNKTMMLLVPGQE
jgi:hypothetical protein